MDLDDEATWSVVGDFLAAQGDQHGELIALDLRRVGLAEGSRERQVIEHTLAECFDRHAPRALGGLARASNLEVTWRRGFIVAATIHPRDPKSALALGVAATLARLLELPAAALLSELTVPGIGSCRKPAALLSAATANGSAAVESLQLPQPRCQRFAALAEFEPLRNLGLPSSMPVDLADLADAPNLEQLDLARSAFDLVAFERGFEALRRLDLRAHPNLETARLGGLANLRLTELDLGEAGWNSIADLAGLATLERLHLRGTDVFDLRPLAGLSRLRFLDLRGCPVADLDPIAGLVELEELRIGWTRVRELRSLRGLCRLKVLEIAGTPVSELGPLAELPELTRIDVQGSDVREVKQLLDRGVQVLGRPLTTAPTWRDLAEGLLRR